MSGISILAHRGLWVETGEKNSLAALQRALGDGFGVETDVRDLGGELVVSHDPAVSGVPTLAEFLRIVANTSSGLGVGGDARTRTLAINIKADGLHALVKDALAEARIENYFCFDMSVPQALVFARNGVRFFTRESEYERSPTLYERAAGVWMDMFESDWIEAADIERHLAAGKDVALVSPELHRRPHQAFWQRLMESGLCGHPGLTLCTDFPTEARSYFSQNRPV